MTENRDPDDVASSALMGVILEGMREAVIATDTLGNIVYANRASRELLGVSLLRADEDDRRVRARPLHEDHVTPVPYDEVPLVRALRGEHVQNMVQWISINPAMPDILLSINAAPLLDGAGEITGAVAWFRDITASKLMEDQLRRLAMTDPLTSAFNRRHGLSRMIAELQRRERYGTPLSVLLADLDHFKLVNDRFGHEAGDTALLALIRIASESVREVDAIIRWGGEEFLVILPETDADGARVFAERLRERVAASSIRTADGAAISITVSIGVAQAETGDPDDLIRRADAALYEAKEAGRNRVAVAVPVAARRTA